MAGACRIDRGLHPTVLEARDYICNYSHAGSTLKIALTLTRFEDHYYVLMYVAGGPSHLHLLTTQDSRLGLGVGMMCVVT